MSTVTGHGHTSAGVGWIVTEEKIWFGMGVGSGVNRKRYAFAYGKDVEDKPILGVGIVSNTQHGVNAQFIPMDMG